MDVRIPPSDAEPVAEAPCGLTDGGERKANKRGGHRASRSAGTVLLTVASAVLSTLLVTAVTLGYSVSSAMPSWLEAPPGENGTAPETDYQPIRGGYLCLRGEGEAFFTPEYCADRGSLSDAVEWVGGERTELAPDELIVSADCCLTGTVLCDGYAYDGSPLPGGESRRIVGVLPDAASTVVLPEDEVSVLGGGEEMRDGDGVAFSGNALQLAVTAVSDRTISSGSGDAVILVLVLTAAVLMAALVACGVISCRSSDAVSTVPDSMYFRYISMGLAVFTATSVGTAWLYSRIEAFGYGSLVEFGAREVIVIAACCVAIFSAPAYIAPRVARAGEKRTERRLLRSGTPRAKKEAPTKPTPLL